MWFAHKTANVTSLYLLQQNSWHEPESIKISINAPYLPTADHYVTVLTGFKKDKAVDHFKLRNPAVNPK